MKFYHNYLNKNLPHFFNQIIFQNNNQIHRYETKINSQFHLPKIKHSLCIRYSLPSILNNAPACITEKIKTHSLNGFISYAKIMSLKIIRLYVLLKTATLCRVVGQIYTGLFVKVCAF